MKLFIIETILNIVTCLSVFLVANKYFGLDGIDLYVTAWIASGMTSSITHVLRRRFNEKA